VAGHSKWANIKHRKARQDAKRGKHFTKLIREIQVSAKLGGGDIDSNPRLRSAVLEARSQSMPKDTIDRAIKRGTGDLEGQNFDQITYEGYGPGGVAVLIECLTDNRNRTVAEIRLAMSKVSGNLGDTGSVAWIFDKKGVILLPKESITEEKLMEVALEAGAEDLHEEGSSWEVVTPPAALESVQTKLTKAGISFDSAQLSTIPKNSVHISGEEAQKMLKLMDALEDMDDVQKVYANFDIDEAELEKAV